MIYILGYVRFSLIFGVSKINELKVLVIPFFPHALLVFDEEVNMLQLNVEAHCYKHQPVEFSQLENVVVLMVEPPHEQVVMVLLILIVF
jgi:hypothetical protein